jgi:hypothetical protein
MNSFRTVETMPLQPPSERTPRHVIHTSKGGPSNTLTPELTGGAYALTQHQEGVGGSAEVTYAPPAILQPDTVLRENHQDMYSDEGIAIFEVGHQPIAQAISLKLRDPFNCSGILAPQRAVVGYTRHGKILAGTGDCGDLRTHHHHDRGTNSRFSRALTGRARIAAGNSPVGSKFGFVPRSF